MWTSPHVGVNQPAQYPVHIGHFNPLVLFVGRLDEAVARALFRPFKGPSSIWGQPKGVGHRLVDINGKRYWVQDRLITRCPSVCLRKNWF